MIMNPSTSSAKQSYENLVVGNRLNGDREGEVKEEDEAMQIEPDISWMINGDESQNSLSRPVENQDPNTAAATTTSVSQSSSSSKNLPQTTKQITRIVILPNLDQDQEVLDNFLLRKLASQPNTHVVLPERFRSSLSSSTDPVIERDSRESRVIRIKTIEPPPKTETSTSDSSIQRRHGSVSLKAMLEDLPRGSFVILNNNTNSRATSDEHQGKPAILFLNSDGIVTIKCPCCDKRCILGPLDQLDDNLLPKTKEETINENVSMPSTSQSKDVQTSQDSETEPYPITCSSSSSSSSSPSSSSSSSFKKIRISTGQKSLKMLKNKLPISIRSPAAISVPSSSSFSSPFPTSNNAIFNPKLAPILTQLLTSSSFPMNPLMNPSPPPFFNAPNYVMFQQQQQQSNLLPFQQLSQPQPINFMNAIPLVPVVTVQPIQFHEPTITMVNSPSNCMQQQQQLNQTVEKSTSTQDLQVTLLPPSSLKNRVVKRKIDLARKRAQISSCEIIIREASGESKPTLVAKQTIQNWRKKNRSNHSVVPSLPKGPKVGNLLQPDKFTQQNVSNTMMQASTSSSQQSKTTLPNKKVSTTSTTTGWQQLIGKQNQMVRVLETSGVSRINFRGYEYVSTDAFVERKRIWQRFACTTEGCRGEMISWLNFRSPEETWLHNHPPSPVVIELP